MRDLKETIVRESMRLFSLKGFLSTSIHDILQAAGTSKGGLYNHFESKEELFKAVLKEAQRIWREKTLAGLERAPTPLDKIRTILLNYRDRYLKDRVHFPGGCIFVTFSVELDDQRPNLARQVYQGFAGFRAMITRLLEEAREAGQIRPGINTEAVTETIFAGMLGASVIYGMEKSAERLDHCIDTLWVFLSHLGPEDESRTKGAGL